MTAPFQVRMAVRFTDLDLNGHVTTAAYLQYADHTRWSLLRAAGVDIEALIGAGYGPVTLETRVRFRRELLVATEVDVSCAFTWSGGKTGGVVQQLRRATDGELAADVESVGGLMDLRQRRLVEAPEQFWRAHAERPDLLGLV